MLIWSTLLQVAGFVSFVFFDVSFFTALINVILFGVVPEPASAVSG
jgi:hypothetical protein